jgi:cytidine deaminase
VLAEFSPEMRVVLATTGGLRKATTLRELLPDAFLPERLPRS